MPDTTITILLSTYNGERYLEEQLASLFAQTWWDKCRLVVRDDGSTDGTAGILRKYEARGLLSAGYGQNLGFTGSFFSLIRDAPESDLYFFCDQDDVWEPDKVERAARMMSGAAPAVPTLYYSDRALIDSGGALIRAHEVVSKIPPTRFNSLTLSCCFGHTLCANPAMLACLRRLRPTDGEIHDWLAQLIAVYTGRLVYDPSPTVRYRVHDASATYMGASRWRMALSPKFLRFQRRIIALSLS
ncbi:MAG: glycosyltransferase, partial [Treponema sp.]|nr:glycosyltransferase [Treponema sp.]